MAEIIINGKSAGVIWTDPYQLDITQYLIAGNNEIEIKVVNTWGNRFLYETRNPDLKNKKINTTAPNKFLKGLLPSGLQGNVELIWQNKK